MKRIFTLVTPLIFLAACGPQGVINYGVNDTLISEEASFTFVSYEGTGMSLETEISIVKHTDALQELVLVLAYYGRQSYDPISIEYNYESYLLSDSYDEYEHLLINLPLVDDIVSLHFEFGMPIDPELNEDLELVTIEYVFNTGSFMTAINWLVNES